VSVCVCVCLYVYLCVYMCICMCAFVCVCVRERERANMYLEGNPKVTRVHACVFSMCVCVCVCVCVCMCMCVHVRVDSQLSAHFSIYYTQSLNLLHSHSTYSTQWRSSWLLRLDLNVLTSKQNATIFDCWENATMFSCCYGVAMISKLLKSRGLFCKRAL